MTIKLIIKCSNDKRLSFEVDPDTTTVLQLKEKIAAELEDTPPNNQRLIYAGRILKDGDSLTTYKIGDGNTIHMVKGGGAKKAPGASSSGASAGAIPSAGAAIRDESNTTTAAAANPVGNSPGATTDRAGQSAGAGALPDMASMLGGMGMGGMGMGGMGMGGGMPQVTPDMIEQIYSNPMTQQMMQQVFSNPQLLRSIIDNNPMLQQQLTPEMRHMLENPEFMQMMGNPDVMRSMVQMQMAMQRAQTGGNLPSSAAAAGGGAGLYNPWASTPASSAPESSAPGTGDSPAAPASSAEQGSTAGAPLNPFAALLNPGLGTPIDPQAVNTFSQMVGGMYSGAQNPPTSSPAASAVPPEERYQQQLQQLNDMGFWDAQQNIRALTMTGGNVSAAIEYLLQNPNNAGGN